MDCPLKVMIELLLSNVVSVLVRGRGSCSGLVIVTVSGEIL
jgi:hypothetical protein